MMKGFYRLINFEFSKWLGFLSLSCAASLLGPIILMYGQVKSYSEYVLNDRFEELYVSSGGMILFLLLLALACAYFLKTVYADYWGGKSIYTFLTLPMKREALYFSRLIVFATGLLLLLASHLIGIRLGYALFAAKTASYGDGQFFMHNGFFLAMIRSEFFRLLLPLSFSRILSTFAILSAVATGFHYGALCERSRRYWGFVPVVAAVWLIIDVISYRLNEADNYYDSTGLYINSAWLLALSLLFVLNGLRLVRRGAIA